MLSNHHPLFINNLSIKRVIKTLFIFFIFTVTTFAQSEVSNHEILFDSFESGFGNWVDGGSDCSISESYQTSGIYSIKLKDNAGINSSCFSKTLDLSSIDEITFCFKYHAVSMEENEDFFLEISTDGGINFNIYEDWIAGVDFENNEYQSESIVIKYDFSDKTIFRLRCDASNNNDQVYIDQIEILEGKNIPKKEIIVVGEKKLINLVPVREKSEVKTIEIFPNPATEQFSINLKAAEGLSGSIEIYNLVGSKLSRSIFKEDHPDIVNYPIEYLEQGYYSVCIRTSDEKLHVMRLMVNR